MNNVDYYDKPKSRCITPIEIIRYDVIIFIIRTLMVVLLQPVNRVEIKRTLFFGYIDSKYLIFDKSTVYRCCRNPIKDDTYYNSGTKVTRC